MTVVVTDVTSASQEIFKGGQYFHCVWNEGTKDLPRERAIDELHMGEEQLIILACVTETLLSIYFS